MIGLGWRTKGFDWALAVTDEGEIDRIPAGKGSDTGHGARLTGVRRLGDGYGNGRVDTSTFGRVWKGSTQPQRMRCAGVQTVVVRALQRLAGRPGTFPLPPEFPDARKTSVRGEIPLPLAP